MLGTNFFVYGAMALTFASVARATSPAEDDMSIIDQMTNNAEVAHRLKMAIKAAKQMQENGPLQETIRTNFLSSLYAMANASAIVGTNASRAAATVIRGFVQDSFSLGSIGAYLPRLIFLDGPSQFVEVLRLVRTNQIRIPMDVDSAMDTLINFATTVRDSPAVGNVANPFLRFFPNVFHGAETLAGDVLFSVFSWLAPINPGDISVGSVNTLINRWDQRSTTTRRTGVN